MNKFDYFKDAFRRYADFKGRSNRPEFWYFVLFNFLAQIVISILDSILGLDYDGGGALSSIYSLVSLIPSIAVSVRRMHDIDKSGWWIIAPLYNIYLSCQPGTAGDNRFGSTSAHAQANPQETHAQV